jgi:endonuclease/exonuclease/phosphatase family metal-dependent hydrolase
MPMGEFSLLSLNTFGIPFYLGWDRLKRMACELDRMPATMLCLQEIQQNAYLPLLQSGLASYPHHIFERHRYAPKGGLAIYSRLSPTRYSFDVYQDRGVWYSISCADWALYKGILSVNLRVENVPIVIMNTHMHANYNGVWHPANPLAQVQHHQVQQMIQATKSLPEDTLIVVCGDLNFPRNSYLYEELIAQTDLIDPLVEDKRSTYRPFPLVPSKWNTSLDYVLIRKPSGVNIQTQPEIIIIEDVAKTSPLLRFLTDHNALLLNTRWETVN